MLIDQLQNSSFRCRIESREVLITVTVTEEMLWDAPNKDDANYKERMEARRRIAEITKERPGEFELVVRHYPDKFIRNISLDSDFKMPWKPWATCSKLVSKALTQIGYIQLSRTLEAEIARRYCRDVETIESLEKQIAVQQRKKEKLVEVQEFAAATTARDNEHHIRDKLDRIVKRAAHQQ